MVVDSLFQSINICFIDKNLSLDDRESIKNIQKRFEHFELIEKDIELKLFKFKSFHKLFIYIDSEKELKKLIEIRDNDKSLKIFIIIDSKNITLISKFLNNNFNFFINKPINQKRIKEIISLCVDREILQKQIFELTQFCYLIMDNSIISKTNRSGEIVFVNDKFCEISGYKRSELLGRSRKILKSENMDSKTIKQISDNLSKHQKWEGILKNLKKDKTEYIVDSTIIPIVDESGTISEVLFIDKDITDKEQLKEEIEIERQKEAFARERDRARESFLILFTHELKTPLNAIINFNEYVMEDLNKTIKLDREKLINLLSISKENAKYMLEIISTLLDIAKLKSKKMSFHYTHFNLVDVVKTTINNFNSLIEKREIDINFKYESENCMIKSDELRLSQIISNILSNAIKYGKSKIFITLDSCYRENLNFRLSIADDGVGIKDKSKVFEIYEQESVNPLNKSEGTGIGLHFVKLLCEELNIGYKLEDSKILGGTNFILSKKIR